MRNLTPCEYAMQGGNHHADYPVSFVPPYTPWFRNVPVEAAATNLRASFDATRDPSFYAFMVGMGREQASYGLTRDYRLLPYFAGTMPQSPAFATADTNSNMTPDQVAVWMMTGN